MGGGSGIPFAFLATDRSRPHEIQHRNEADSYIEGAGTLHFVANDRARDIERNKELFADDEIGKPTLNEARICTG
jgi:hypothetical protein